MALRPLSKEGGGGAAAIQTCWKEVTKGSEKGLGAGAGDPGRNAGDLEEGGAVVRG